MLQQNAAITLFHVLAKAQQLQKQTNRKEKEPQVFDSVSDDKWDRADLHNSGNKQ